MAAPRTLRFMFMSAVRGRQAPIYPDPPSPRPTPGLAMQVAMDEVILAAMKSPKRYPHRVDYSRVGGEVVAGAGLYRDRGWLERPLEYHRTPPPVETVVVKSERTWNARYEHIAFPSEYEPWPDEPGRDRWLDYEANRTAHAYVLRHKDGEPRPWLVCVHGFGTGRATMDFPAFRAKRLHDELGLNLILPVLPMHGPRNADGRTISGAEMMSFDMMNSVLGLAQAAWDIRRAISWARAQGAETVGIYGLSLGGYATALTASIEPDLAVAIAGIPACDLPALFAHHCPPRLRRRAVEHHLLGRETADVHRVVSPLALQPQVPRDRRFIVGGLGDRMSTPKQAYRLWLHWDQPEMAWYGGNHVGYFWSREADRFVRSALEATLARSDAAPPPTRPAPAASRS